jgi:hypothetical protein
MKTNTPAFQRIICGFFGFGASAMIAVDPNLKAFITLLPGTALFLYIAITGHSFDSLSKLVIGNSRGGSSGGSKGGTGSTSPVLKPTGPKLPSLSAAQKIPEDVLENHNSFLPNQSLQLMPGLRPS